jgi:hypothetical protein
MGIADDARSPRLNARRDRAEQDDGISLASVTLAIVCRRLSTGQGPPRTRR